MHGETHDFRVVNLGNYTVSTLTTITVSKIIHRPADEVSSPVVKAGLIGDCVLSHIKCTVPV